MAIAEHHPEKLRGLVPDMTKAQMHDFAATPERGLPAHVKNATHPARNLGHHLRPPKRAR